MSMGMTLAINLGEAMQEKGLDLSKLLQRGGHEAIEIWRILEDVGLNRGQGQQASIMLAECELLVALLKYRLVKMQLLDDKAEVSVLPDVEEVQAFIEQLNTVMTRKVLEASASPARSAA